MTKEMKIIKDIIKVECLGDMNNNMSRLLVETCCVESDLGQTSSNIMQMEDATRQDIITHYLRPKEGWFRQHLRNCSLNKPYFCIHMAKIHYLRTGVDIPDSRLERAKLWKKSYNTHLGKGTVEDYMEKSQLYLGDE
jgi:hypothetical protein